MISISQIMAEILCTPDEQLNDPGIYDNLALIWNMLEYEDKITILSNLKTYLESVIDPSFIES